jgi:tetrahydromethanopterin S-methyltransferase subunit C
MVAIGFVLIVFALILHRINAPTDPREVMADALGLHQRKGAVISGLALLIGIVLVVIGIAIQLWKYLP